MNAPPFVPAGDRPSDRVRALVVSADWKLVVGITRSVDRVAIVSFLLRFSGGPEVETSS